MARKLPSEMQSLHVHRQLDQKSSETLHPRKNFPPRNQAKFPQLTHHKESSQPICNANQLTGFHKKPATIKSYLSSELRFEVSEQALADNRSIKK